MKMNLSRSNRPQAGDRVVATFGQAELVQHPNGRYELRGGRPEDRAEAREWTSLFLHEAVF